MKHTKQNIYIVNNYNNNMVNEIKKNGEVILKYLNYNENITLTELTNKIKLSRGQIRIAVAFLLGAEKISEFKLGMAKVYNLQ